LPNALIEFPKASRTTLSSNSTTLLNKASQNEKTTKSMLLEINRLNQKGAISGKKLEEEEAFYVD